MKILVVDDEPLISDLLGTFFEDQGHEVVVLTDGLAAADAWLEHDFDLLISDLRLPGLSGIDLVRRIRTVGGRQPCLLISGHVQASTLDEIDGLQPIDVLPKPFSFTDLDAAIEGLIGG